MVSLESIVIIYFAVICNKNVTQANRLVFHNTLITPGTTSNAENTGHLPHSARSQIAFITVQGVENEDNLKPEFTVLSYLECVIGRAIESIRRRLCFRHCN